MRELQPGTVVTASIRLVRRLGAGGMGSVWIAEHLALRTQVVVKFMAVELAASAEAVERFSREAAAAAQVKSPHVVQMLDHGVTADGIAFIVMELLEGHDLGKHLAARGRITIPETAEIIGQVCKALARAHERGIVHRDIKPDNIFLCGVGEGETFVKLLDFGIAKGDARLGVGSSGTKTGTMIGTPYYMSPEQIVGARNIDRRTDLWSLGIVAYECVLGARPFNEDIFGALAIRIHSGPIPVPSQADPALPPAFDQWFARACARDVNARFGTAKEFGDGLARVASGGFPEQRISGPVPSPVVQGVHGWQPANTPAAPGAPFGTSTPPVLGGPTAASTPAPGSHPSTNAGLGLSTGTPRPSGAGTATWVIAAVVSLVVVGIAGVFAYKRIGASPPAPSAAASVAMPSVPSPPPSALGVAPAQPSAEPAPPAPAPVANPVLDGASSHPAAAQPRPSPAAKPAQPRPAATPSATGSHEKDIF
jgi:serine/threonine-protein kinase